LESHAQVRERVPGEILGELQKSGDSSDIETAFANSWNGLNPVNWKSALIRPSACTRKLYIMTFKRTTETKAGFITGSSNLTEAGLQDNLEFNVELKNRSDYDFAIQKFTNFGPSPWT